MSWVPRFPEVKHQLQIGNGQFGTLISMGAVGSVISLIIAGPLVHRFGSRKVMSFSVILIFLTLAYVVHVTSVWQFLFCNMAIGAGVSGFHIAVNSQALHEQRAGGESLMPRLHGVWSVGAITTAILSGLLIGHVSLATHIDSVAIFVLISILILIKKLGKNSLKGKRREETDYSVRSIFARSNIDWLMGLGATCAAALEYSTSDWAAIFSKEELHMGAGVSTLPYILFISTMIIGRLTSHRLTDHIGIDRLIRLCTIIGGVTFIVAINVGVQVSKSLPTLGFSIVLIGYFVGGLGVSFLIPTFMHAASRRSNAPGSVALGQLGAINTTLILIVKPIIAWTAQLTSIRVALIIPGVMLIGVAFFASAVKKALD